MLNRAAILASIQHQIDKGAGSGGFAVMAMRIFDLRLIPLRFGSASGEQAETRVGKLIGDALRPGDTVLQSGDETFVAILPGLHNRNHVLLAIANIAAIFEQAHVIANDVPPWQARAAMGVALHPEDGADADALWRNAQAALDDAQRRGDQYLFHDPTSARALIDYHDLRDSITANRLATYFQPMWNLAGQRIAGVESLARWTTRTQRPVQPDDFVTFAEQNHLISALTRWSIHSTLRHASTLPHARDFMLAINLSPQALSRGGVVEQLMDALNIWGMAPTSIVAEVTETALARDMDLAVHALRRLRDHGVRVAIDDFGVGYASITYLLKFPVTELKIDRSLIALIATDARVARLVDAIIRFAHNLGLLTTAEGIEDAATLRLLVEMGCDLGQGYYLGRPEPADDFIARFKVPATAETTAAK